LSKDEAARVVHVYMLRCSDGSYYVGSARLGLEKRVAEHNSGAFGGYTSKRRPVELVWHQEFDRITDAIAAERRIKGWSRAKKEALIRGDFVEIQRLALGRTNPRRFTAR
jgi:putative endonuclease